MTREDAKDQWFARAYSLSGEEFDGIIDEIYDNHDIEIKELKHEINRLRKQLSQYEHIKPRFEYGEPR
jgi:hypothetical protein